MNVQNYRADSIQEYEIEMTRDIREEIAEIGGLMEPLLEIVVAEAAEKAVAETEKKRS